MPHHISILFILDSAEGILGTHSLLILIIMINNKKFSVI